jgi:hypothetical protein
MSYKVQAWGLFLYCYLYCTHIILLYMENHIQRWMYMRWCNSVAVDAFVLSFILFMIGITAKINSKKLGFKHYGFDTALHRDTKIIYVPVP